MATVTPTRSRPDSGRADAKARHSKMDGLRELSKGLKIEAQFCPAELADPFDTVEWELRTAQIKDENGKLMFEQTDCEIPAGLDASSPPTSSSASTSTARTARPSASGASGSSFTASPAPSPTGASPTATSPAPETASASIAS